MQWLCEEGEDMPAPVVPGSSVEVIPAAVAEALKQLAALDDEYMVALKRCISTSPRTFGGAIGSPCRTIIDGYDNDLYLQREALPPVRARAQTTSPRMPSQKIVDPQPHSTVYDAESADRKAGKKKSLFTEKRSTPTVVKERRGTQALAGASVTAPAAHWEKLRMLNATMISFEVSCQLSTTSEAKGAAGEPVPPAAASQGERRRLRAQAPKWWTVTEAVGAAADAFDRRHETRSSNAERLARELAAGSQEAMLATPFDLARFDVQSNRFVAPVAPPKQTHSTSPRANKARAKQAGKQEVKVFELSKSVWGPRSAHADSRDYYDSEEVELCKFQADWENLLQMNLTKLILMHDDDATPGDEDGDGIPDEVEEVGLVLWDHHAMLASLFTFYACAGGRGLGGIGLNQWTELANDFGLGSKKSRFCKRRDLDRIFIAADTAHVEVKASGSKDVAAQLSRLQFYCAMIRVAIAKYVLPKIILDVSEALKELLEKDFLGPVGTPGHEWASGVFLDKDRFRRYHCYTEQASEVLAANETSLRNLFDALRTGGGRQSARSLLSLDEWLGFLRAARLVGSDVSDREATMCFAWSRMTVIHAAKKGSEERDRSLPFEGFLEALCRVAVMKALPTRKEMAAAGYERREDCGAYIAYLKVWGSGWDRG